jgi:hypothetical protein
MRRLSILVVLAFLALAAPVWAQVPAPRTDEAAKQQALKIAIDWLQANTAYKQLPDIRNWVNLSAEQMSAQARRGNLPGSAARVPAAIYSCGQNTLYLQQGVNFFDVAILSLLVHELTHHAQCLTRVPMNDICVIEREAYLNQQRFVRWMQARLASTGQPLGPEVEKFAQDINPLIATVCAATRKPN